MSETLVSGMLILTPLIDEWDLDFFPRQTNFDPTAEVIRGAHMRFTKAKLLECLNDVSAVPKDIETIERFDTRRDELRSYEFELTDVPITILDKYWLISRKRR